RHGKLQSPERSVVVRVPAERVLRPIPLHVREDTRCEAAQFLVAEARGESDVADAARGNVDARIARNAVEYRVVVDEQIEINAIEPQPDRVRIVDSKGEVEIDRRSGQRKRERYVRPDVPKRIPRILNIQRLRHGTAPGKRQS